jgi:hypothetical protein
MMKCADSRCREDGPSYLPTPLGAGLADRLRRGGCGSIDAVAAADQPPLMNRQREIALALSACPVSVASKAAIYVLEVSGYVKVRESQNRFTAIVQHSLPTS